MGLFGKKKKDEKKFEFRLVNRLEKEQFFQILREQGWIEVEPPFEFDKNWETDRIRRAAKAYALKLGAEMLVEVEDPSFSSNIYNDLVFYVFKMDPYIQAQQNMPQAQYQQPEAQYSSVGPPAQDCYPQENNQAPAYGQQQPQAHDPRMQQGQSRQQGYDPRMQQPQSQQQGYDPRMQQGQSQHQGPDPRMQTEQQPPMGYDPRMQQPQQQPYDPRYPPEQQPVPGQNPYDPQYQQQGQDPNMQGQQPPQGYDPYGQNRPQPMDPYGPGPYPPGMGPPDGGSPWGAPPEPIPYQPDEDGKIRVTETKELFLKSNYSSHEEAFLHTLDNLAKLLSMDKCPFRFLDNRTYLHPTVRIMKGAYYSLGTRQMDLVLMKEAVNTYKIMGNESHSLSNVSALRDTIVVISTLGIPTFHLFRDYDELDEASKSDITQALFNFLECYLPKV